MQGIKWKVWGFTNATDKPLDKVALYYSVNGWNDWAGAGALQPSAEKEWGFGDDPIPDRVRLHWRTDDGLDHDWMVDVASKVPDIQRFSGAIWFKYTGGYNWVVIPITNEQAFERGKKWLPTVP